MAVGDAEGKLLWVSGPRDVMRRAERIHFVEGSVWDEGSAGTNAPGMALHLDTCLLYTSALADLTARDARHRAGVVRGIPGASEQERFGVEVTTHEGNEHEGQQPETDPACDPPAPPSTCHGPDPIHHRRPAGIVEDMRAIWNGTVIAESDDTVVVEGNHYFPARCV